MNSIDPAKPPQQGPLAGPKANNKVRRCLLLVSLGGLVLFCSFCWYTTQVETVEQIFIPGLMGFVLLYTLFILSFIKGNKTRTWTLNILY